MMDFGYLGSSSNLSPLASPFTLDRTIPQPNSEQFSNFRDLPPTFPYSSSLPTWPYSLSPASNPNCYSDSSADFGADPIRTTYPGSESYYPYFGVSSINSPTTHMPPLNANASTTPDTFIFPQFSGPMPTSYVEPETYCHSFVSPATEPKSNYDLSSTSQVDYLQSLSGLKYTPHWGSYWDNIDSLEDGEMSKQADYDGRFCSAQMDDPYADQGSDTVEGFSICKESHPSVRLDLFVGGSQITTPVTCEVNSLPFPTQGSSFTRYDPARSFGIPSFPKSHANVPCVEAAITTILNHQKPYESQDRSFQPLNADTSESVTTKKSSPPVVIRPPPVGFGLCLDKNEPFCGSFPSNVRDTSNKHLTENVGHLSKAEKELLSPSMNAPLYSFTSLADRAKSVSSVEGPLESLDRYYPALDSPCWKGVSSFRSSPSEDHESVNPEHSIKKCKNLKHQQTQFCTPFGEDNAKNYSKKAMENGYVELGSLLCPDSFPNANSPVKVGDSIHDNGADHAYISSSNFDPVSNNIEKLAKEFDSFGDSKNCSNLKPVQLKKSDFENDIELGFGVAQAGLDCDGVSSKLDVQQLVETIHNLSKLLLLQCSDDSALVEVGQEFLKLAMKNLDECVSKMIPKPIDESNLQKSAISGRHPLPKEASSCLGFDYHRPKQERKSSELSEKEVKNFTNLFSARVDKDFEKDNKLTRSVISSMPPLPKEASSFLGFDNHRPEQGRKNSELSDEEVKKFTDLLSARVDEDFENDNKLTRGIKKVFEDNFSAKEEMQSETLFYKNLWLEAEAALCSASFRARIDRVKAEMDKYKSSKNIEPVKTFEELYNEVFPDPSSPGKGNPMIEAFKKLHRSNQDPSSSTTFEAVNEAEASFKARLDIPNNRLPNQNSEYTTEQTDEEVDAAFAETIKTVEKLLSSDDVEDCSMTNPIPKVPRQHAPSSSTTNTSHNLEASVMARLQILNDRGGSGISEKSTLESEQALSFKYPEQINPWEYKSRTTDLDEDDIAYGPLSRDCKVSEHEMANHFRVRASNDVANQLNMNIKSENQISGWDGSLSDWEDVLKDEFACQK